MQYIAELTICPCTFPHVKLAEAEVAKCNVSRIVKKNVFGLQVSVDDIETVQTLQSAKQLSRVKSRSIDVETLLFLQVMKQLATVDKGKHKIELLR